MVNGTEGAAFITPPSRPPGQPMAPRKNRVDRRSVQINESPSVFPNTTARLGMGESHSVTFVSSPTNANASSMALQSEQKLRRSTRIKSKCKYYCCIIETLKFYCRFYYVVFISCVFCVYS